MNVTFITTTRAKLSQLPIVSGQLVYLNDENTSYYDMGSSRYLVTAVREVSALPSVGYEGIIYVVTTANPRTSWLWDATSSKFVNIAGARATTTSPGIVQPDGTTVTVNNGVISSNFSQAEKTKLSGIAAGATVTAFTPSLTTGTKVGQLEINGTTYDIYAPSAAVSYTPTVTSGTELGTLTINGVDKIIYTPTIGDASTSAAGLMSAADKTKLNGIQTGATAVSYSPTLTSGDECGKITINGTAYSIYSAAASGVTGVKGDSESSYRTGNVNITKTNIGLGNVPNVTTNNQAPTFTQASSRANIASGETLATIFGKIMKWFADLKTVAFSGSYTDLSDQPTIPTVNNAKLTIQKNGTNVQTFTANQSTNATANITVPTKVSELTNDSGYTTNTGTVTQVKVGTTAYNPSSGIISLPAYPTDTNNHRVFYGTCSTAAATAAKVIALSDTTGWELKAGTTVVVRFTNTNTASNVTLNVNSSGAKSIYYSNATYTGSSSTVCGYAARTYVYTYDGTYWVWVAHGVDDNTTYSSKAAASGGTDVSLVTTGEKYTWNNKGTGTVTQVKVGTTAYDPSSGVVSLPAYPTVNNATLTIQKNGTNVQTFTANASSNKTANITVPTKVSELTNDSGYITDADVVTGVKGSSETTYRTGQVNITKANVGLGNVPNPTIVTGSLAADATSITLSSSAITTSSTVAVYSTVADLEYTSISVATGSVTVGFPSSHAAATVKVYVF